MAYRRTKKYSAARLSAMKAGRDMERMERPATDYPEQLPELRIRITVERFDFGAERHVIELRRTNRIDVYAASVDGVAWCRAGLTQILAGLRKAMPRVASPRAIS